MKSQLIRAVIVYTTLATFAATRSFANESGYCTLEIQPVQESYVLGEPIRLMLSIHNSGDETTRVKLGAEGVDNLVFHIEKGGTQIVIPEYVPPGFGQVFYLTVAPKETGKQIIYLDDVFTAVETAAYAVSVHVKNIPALQAEAQVVIEPFSEAARERLEKAYSDLWHELQNQDVITPPEILLRKFIVLSKNPAARDVQLRMLEDGKWSYDEFQTMVSALVRPRDADSIREIVRIVLKNAHAREHSRQVVYYELQKAGAIHWDGELYELIAPYAGNILKVSCLNGA